MDEIKLSERKKQILISSIDDYIRSASPITSGAVHENHLKNISSATLRNELNALEAMGYLKQLHTSGGRVPTSKAYRFFVSEIMKDVKFDKKSLTAVRQIFNNRTESLTDIVSELADMISEATNYPTFVVLNNYKALVIENIKIVPLIDGSGIVLITTKSGIINNSIKLQSGTTQESCIDASNFLTKHFQNKTIAEMITNLPNYLNEMQVDLNDFKGIFNNLMECLENLNETMQSVAKAGTTKLLNNPEYSNINSAKKVLNTLENEEEIKKLLSSQDDENISIKIGSENSSEALENCSVIKADYKVDGNTIASIGIVGPQRMDYGKTAGALKFIVEELNKIHLLDNSKDKGGKT